MSQNMKITLVNVDDIKPYPLNVKIHEPKQVAKIAESIKKFGWNQPIVVDRNNVIIAGHGRRLAAISLGYKQVPVWKRDDLDEDEVRAARLADNRVAISDVDSALLQEELATLNFDLDGIFDAKELDFINADIGEVTEGAFAEDIEFEVAKQAEEGHEKVKEADGNDIAIAKALGFKSIKGSQERYVAKFMAKIEADSGLPADEAFVKFVRELMTE